MAFRATGARGSVRSNSQTSTSSQPRRSPVARAIASSRGPLPTVVSSVKASPERSRHCATPVNGAGAQITILNGAWTDTKNDWVRIEGRTVLPVGTARYRLLLQTERSTSDTTYTYWGRISARRAASAQMIVDGAIITDKLAANSVVASKLAIASQNMAYNPRGDQGLRGYGISTQFTGATGLQWLSPGLWAPAGFRAIQIGTAATQVQVGNTYSDIIQRSVDSAGNPVNYPCAAGITYEASACFSTHRCSGQIIIAWCDSAGTAFSYSYGNTVPSNGIGGGTAYRDFPKSSVIAVAPAGATQFLIILRGAAPYSGDAPHLFVSALMVSAAHNGQTQVSDYVDPGATLIEGGNIFTGSLHANRIQALTISANEIAADAITANKIAVDAVTAVKIAAGSITTAKLAALAVTANELAANAVTSAKISAGAVTTASMTAGTINADRLVAGSVTANQLAANSVTAVKIVGGTITGDKIATGTITTGLLAAQSITANKLALVDLNNLVANGDFAQGITEGWARNFGSVTLSNAASGDLPTGCPAKQAIKLVKPSAAEVSLSTADFGADTGLALGFPISWNEQYYTEAWVYSNVAGASVALEVVTRDVNGSIAGTGGAVYLTAPTANTWHKLTGTQLIGDRNGRGYVRVSNATNPSTTWVTLVKVLRRNGAALIVDGTITGSQLVANTITASQIASGTITATQIAAGTITALQIAVNTITAAQIAADTITSTQIATGAITADELAANAVTAVKISAGAITAREIAAGAITAAKLTLSDPSNMVLNGDFLNGTVDGWTGVVLNTDCVIEGPFQNDPGGAYRLRTNARDAAYTSVATAQAGDEIYVSAMVANFNAGRANLFVQAIDGQGGSIGLFGGAYTDTKNAWVRLEGRLALPAGTARFRLLLQTERSTTDSTWTYWGRVSARRAASAQMIVDGSIITDKLAANSVVASKLAVASQNMAFNPRGDQGLRGYQHTVAWTNSTPVSLGVPGDWAPAAYRSIGVGCSATVAQVGSTYSDIVQRTVDASGNPVNYPCVQNVRYEASVCVSSHRCTGQLIIVWCNAAGSAIGFSYGTAQANNQAGNGVSYRDFPKSAVIDTAPAGATQFFIVLRGLSPYVGDSPYAFFSALMISTAHTGQSQVSDYVDPGVTIIDGGNIVTNSLHGNRITAGTIGADRIVAASITSTQIAANAITATQIAAGAVNTDELAANAVTAYNISANSITAREIATGAITADEIAANAIQAVHILAGQIISDKIGANQIYASHIVAGQITTEKIATNAITADKILANQITAAKIAVGAVGADQIAAGAILADKIGVGLTNGNLLHNTDYMSGGWSIGNTPNPALSRTLAGLGDPNAPAGMQAAMLHGLTNGAYADVSFNTVGSDGTVTPLHYNVQRGKRYEFSAYVNCYSSAGADLGVACYDGNGNLIVDYHGGHKNEVSLGSLTQWPRLAMFFTMPIGTYYAIFYVRTYYNTTGQQTYTFISGAYLGLAQDNQTQFSPWSPASNTVINGGQIATNTLHANRIVAGTITGDRIAGSTISGGNIVGNTITGGHIQANSIGTGHIIANSINSSHIAANSIDARNIRIQARPINTVGIDFSVNKNTRVVSWTGGYVLWVDYNGAARSVFCPAGSYQAVGAYSYFWWCASEGVQDAVRAGSDNWGTIFSNPENVMLASYDGAAGLNVLTGGTIIDGTRINTGSITANQIGASQINAGHIGAGQITATHIGAGQVTTDKLAAYQVTAEKIAGRSITALQIAVGAIGAAEIAARSITADRLQANSITFTELSGGRLIVSEAQIDNLIVGNSKLQNNAVSSVASSSSSGNNTGVNIYVRGTGKVLVKAGRHGNPGQQVGTNFNTGNLRISRNGVEIFAIPANFMFRWENSVSASYKYPLGHNVQLTEEIGAGSYFYAVADDNNIGLGGVYIEVTELSK